MFQEFMLFRTIHDSLRYLQTKSFAAIFSTLSNSLHIQLHRVQKLKEHVAARTRKKTKRAKRIRKKLLTSRTTTTSVTLCISTVGTHANARGRRFTVCCTRLARHLKFTCVTGNLKKRPSRPTSDDQHNFQI